MPPDTTFVITPSGDDYSMVSDAFFSSLQANQYEQSVNPDVALDWLLNVKKFCVAQESDGECFRGIYEATYGIEDYASYANPVTDLAGSYKEPQIGGSDSSNPTGAAGQMMQTSPRNPHRYTLQEDSNNVGNPPSQLTGEYLGAFFHHKGSWYSSFDDASTITSDPITSKEITENTKKVETEQSKKKIFVQDKFFPKGAAASIEDCLCPCSFGGEASGGDEGYSNSFDLNREGVETTLEIYFQAYSIKDGITVTAGGQTFSSGCISDSVTHLMHLPNGAKTISVTIQPNCEGDTGTAWYFTITCVDNAPP
jgi:hypothetical protein